MSNHPPPPKNLLIPPPPPYSLTTPSNSPTNPVQHFQLPRPDDVRHDAFGAPLYIYRTPRKDDPFSIPTYSHQHFERPRRSLFGEDDVNNRMRYRIHKAPRKDDSTNGVAQCSWSNDYKRGCRVRKKESEAVKTARQERTWEEWCKSEDERQQWLWPGETWPKGGRTSVPYLVSKGQKDVEQVVDMVGALDVCCDEGTKKKKEKGIEGQADAVRRNLTMAEYRKKLEAQLAVLGENLRILRNEQIKVEVEKQAWLDGVKKLESVSSEAMLWVAKEMPQLESRVREAEDCVKVGDSAIATIEKEVRELKKEKALFEEMVSVEEVGRALCRMGAGD